MTQRPGSIQRIAHALINLLFHCGHRHLTRPFTSLGEPGASRRETYVVCLDCTRPFSYDWAAMRVGKAIDHTREACVIPPDLGKGRKKKLLCAFGVAVPAAVLAAAALKTMRPAGEK